MPLPQLLYAQVIKQYRRKRVVAVGRRVNTLCQGEDGLQHQLTLFHVYHNFVLPHTSLRQPLKVPASTNCRRSAKV
jgi:hypothetical protein